MRSRHEPSLSAEPRELLERVERDGDLFAPLLTLEQELPDLAGSSRAAAEFGSLSAAGKPSARTAAKTAVKTGPRGRTREQLYQEARKLNINGRSEMNKEQLQRAVDARK